MEITIGHKLIDKSLAFARCQYRNSKRLNKNFTKTSLSLSRRIDMAFAGRLAECAVYLYLNYDPYEHLDWTTGKSDAGYDLKINETTIDVKASDHPGASRLMWPIKKIDTLDKAADILLFARVPKSKATKIGQVIELVGFVNRERFIKEHKKAKFMRGIVDGTPYFNEEDLYKIKHLKHYI